MVTQWNIYTAVFLMYTGGAVLSTRASTKKGVNRMGKSVKLEPETYAELDQLRTKRETFSQVVQRLLDMSALVRAAATRLGMGQTMDLEGEPK